MGQPRIVGSRHGCPTSNFLLAHDGSDNERTVLLLSREAHLVAFLEAVQQLLIRGREEHCHGGHVQVRQGLWRSVTLPCARSTLRTSPSVCAVAAAVVPL